MLFLYYKIGHPRSVDNIPTTAGSIEKLKSGASIRRPTFEWFDLNYKLYIGHSNDYYKAVSHIERKI